ncbi:MAG TPA: dihydroorotate dehydrogenase electron transfer subunit [Nitrospirota bacterium]|nr:dihydroorotate dehydrogenase electron transfer subunit [Nitrospirota bacterium]
MPSSRFHKATILVNKSVGRGYFRLVLRAPEISAAALPGQFVMLRVSETMDPLLARPFGISSLPSRSSLELIYRVIGRGTSLLTQRKAGDSLNLLGPIGNGFPLPGKDATPVLIAGGSGFPPLHFLSAKAGFRAHLFIGARNKDCLPPAGIVKSFRDTAVRVHLATEDGSAGKRGMTTDLLNAFLTTRERKTPLVLYACGPHAMLGAVSRIAAIHSLPCFVSLEERMACGVGACMGCSVAMKSGGYKRVCKDGPVFASRDIEWSEQVVVKLVARQT